MKPTKNPLPPNEQVQSTLAMSRALWGPECQVMAARLFMQDSGVASDLPSVATVGLIHNHEIRDNHAEIWLCEIIVRPVRRFRDTTDNFRGVGLAGAITGGGISQRTMATEILADGTECPNPDYEGR